MLSEEYEQKVLKVGMQSGAFTLSEDLSLEMVVTLHLNPKHPFYKKFMWMLHDVQKKQKGLVKYSSGL